MNFKAPILCLAALCALSGVARAADPGQPIAIPTGTPGIVIPAATSVRAIRYQVQGTGFACVSFNATATSNPPLSIANPGANATCGGAAAFLVTVGSVDSRLVPAPVPSGAALWGIASGGSTLQIAYEVLQ